MKRSALFVLVLFTSTWMTGCYSTQPIAMEPASALRHDVFTCKGLSEDKRWIGVTDEFLPEEDPRVVIVARLEKEDLQKIVIYELINPLGVIALTERRIKPRSETLGVYFEMRQLLERGGEGRWVANVYSDDASVGQAVFYVGERPDDDDDLDHRFFIIGEESLAAIDEAPVFMSDEERYSNYIREVAPETPNDTATSNQDEAFRGANVTP